jgi:outer membrane protein OmpA-like peptidoglycan-associated protein
MNAIAIKSKKETESTKSLSKPETQINAIQESGTRAGMPLFIGGAPLPQVQPKLRISQPGDRYEQEADQAADQVMGANGLIAGQGAGHHPGDSSLSPRPAYEPAKALKIDADAVLPSEGGQPLGSTTRMDFEARYGYDFDSVRIHTGWEAAQKAESIQARAYTADHDIVFGAGEYAPSSEGGRFLLAHELAHVVQQTGDSRHDSVGDGPLIQRREYGPLEDTDEMGQGDWTHADRLNRTARWSEANHYNLLRGNSSAYTQIDQRRDFYWWFYETMAARGHEIRWPLAAAVVAGGANEVANRLQESVNRAPMAVGLDPVMRPDSLEQLMRRGNQVIFDDVFPKLRELYLRNEVLTGEDAQAWDAQTLIEEQNLIQPLYEDLSPEDLATMEGLAKQEGLAGSSVARGAVGFFSLGLDSAGTVEEGAYNTGGDVPPFPADFDLTNPVHRFRYGMYLADYFGPAAGGDVETHRAGSMARAMDIPVPEAPEAYTSEEMLAHYDRFRDLHAVTALLTNPDASSDDLREMIQSLSPHERAVLARDPWYVAALRHIHHMSPIQAEALLTSEDISGCVPTSGGNAGIFQVIGGIEGTGNATAEDNIIVAVTDEAWENRQTYTGGTARVQVQAISQPAIQMFGRVPLRWVWTDSLRCYPRPVPEPEPVPEPIEQVYRVYFDTGSATLYDDSPELSGMQVLNQVLEQLQTYGDDDAIDSIELTIVGHASPRWESASSGTEAFMSNYDLADQRAAYIRHYINDRYSEFQGPAPLVVRAPMTSPIFPEENVTPAQSVTSLSMGSVEGLVHTLDPSNNEERYRRVDIRLKFRFENRP